MTDGKDGTGIFNPKTGVVDLNLADGAAAAYLGSPPAMGLASFGPAAERMDAALLAALLTSAPD